MDFYFVLIAFVIAGTCFGADTTQAKASATEKLDNRTRSGVPESTTIDDNTCSFSNLEKVIKHDSFSITGKASNCEFFFFTGEDIKNHSIKMPTFNSADGTECTPLKPMFYSKKTGKTYHLFTATHDNAYLFDCNWKFSPAHGYYSCNFNRTEAEEKSLDKPIKSVHDRIRTFGTVNDPHTEELHLIYTHSDNFYDSTYDLKESNFTANSTIELAGGGDGEDIQEPIAYDPDLKRFYFQDSKKYYYLEVSEKDGIRNYSKKPVKVENIPAKKHKALSFSNDFFIYKDKHGTDEYRYYVGHTAENTQYCILSTKDNGILLELIVKNNNTATYEGIRSGIEPLPVVTTTTTATPPMTKSGSLSFVSVCLTALLLTVAFSFK